MATKKDQEGYDAAGREAGAEDANEADSLPVASSAVANPDVYALSGQQTAEAVQAAEEAAGERPELSEPSPGDIPPSGNVRTVEAQPAPVAAPAEEPAQTKSSGGAETSSAGGGGSSSSRRSSGSQ